MAHGYPVPEAFAHLTELSLEATGSFVLFATDDYFAPADALLRPHAPEWREGAYTERGKWMDGWESQRRRTPGHDWAVIRLGTPGSVKGVVCDTTHFKGNAPQEVSLEVAGVSPAMPLEDLLALPTAADSGEAAALGWRAWVRILGRVPLAPDSVNVFDTIRSVPRASHVRLRIHPDGGVARLRVFGHVRPDPDIFRGPGSVDLAAIENGGTIALASDAFFGPPSNLLLPGRGTDIGDGWETRRRRTPGSDWCVIRLGRRGHVQHLELDTHFFKGNAPQAVRIDGLDAEGIAEADLDARLAAPGGWSTVIDRTALSPHRRHRLVPVRPALVSHLRVHIFPHGGVNRLRAFGEAVDTAGEARALAALHALAPGERREALRAFGASDAFAEALEARLPAPSVRALVTAAMDVLGSLSPAQLVEAFAAHPELGAPPAASDASAHASWSRAEQSALRSSAAAALERLRAGTAAYRERFGFPFIAFAAGRGAGELADALEDRLANDREAEIGHAARELARIARRRIDRWLAAHSLD